MEEWQRYQMGVIVDPRHTETLIIRSRGGSKTFDMMIVLLYYAMLGFAVIFGVAKGPQLTQPQKYLHQIVNKCFLKFSIDQHKFLERSCLFKNGGTFEIVHMTEANVRSKRCDVLYYDEESQIEELAYDASQPMLSKSKLAKIIHGSTPQKGTVFEKNYRRLQQEGKPVFSRKWYEIGYINKELIDREKKTKPAWYFRQEYECSFEAPMGKVFTDVLEHDFSVELNDLRDDYQRTYPHGGIDWNPSAGHWFVTTRVSDDRQDLFVLSEKNLGTELGFVFEYLIDWLRENPKSVIELEDGGTNMGYCDAFMLYCHEHEVEKEITRRVYRRSWDSAGKNKHKSINSVSGLHIHVNPSITPEVADWLDIAHWDAKADSPKLEKDPNQHALDSFLHASWVALWGV